MVPRTTARSNRNRNFNFKPDANESDDHRRAKEKLRKICMTNGMDAGTEFPVATEYKTYYCDVLAAIRFFGSVLNLDLEVEDHDHSKHDFDDAENKTKELRRYFIKTIWFKSVDILHKLSETEILAKILCEMIDGRETNPRMNI